ncbi:MAG: bifunctional diaminohydroxyphosphoribosylaminopyrimidine deaminase/5-amino-6-(5-phosphoribosylamino)uracil reductase RibD, partial [Planctomycetes bacterium]|nr:bifunctional diaminohydroxyphosphoribosylaminopyrimidine deaminase/5-amino-6-(5-phosphoribosylamino)uracil reductase RibD [Planctomycetota bacterium]
MVRFDGPEDAMRRALVLARRGIGRVEPNPAVGAVVVTDDWQLLGEGWHAYFGGPHAEVAALAAAGDAARGATLCVTLEPCSHHGKTPPCADAVIRAGVKRVCVAMSDPFPLVAGGGLHKLREAQVEVDLGILESDARELVAPFCKLVQFGMPFVHAKWAMTLDGRIASRTGASQWISNADSRSVVHELRGRMDAILVGIGTALADDPQLTVRPRGLRVPTRIILDRQARLPLDSQLVRSIDDAPVLVVTSSAAPANRVARLQDRGVEVLSLEALPPAADGASSDLVRLLRELGRRKLTNLLVEGGGAVLGAFFDEHLVDEAHVFVAPKILGGAQAIPAVAGLGRSAPHPFRDLDPVQFSILGDNVYIRGLMASPQT